MFYHTLYGNNYTQSLYCINIVIKSIPDVHKAWKWKNTGAPIKHNTNSTYLKKY